MQVKEGAAWVAVEHSRGMQESADGDGQHIKTTLAYSDKNAVPQSGEY